MDETTEVQHKVRRVRRTKAQIEADNAAEAVGIVAPVESVDTDNRAQEYAMRIWNGQSISAPRDWRIQRVTEGLEGQGMSMEGVVLPA